MSCNQDKGASEGGGPGLGRGVLGGFPEDAAVLPPIPPALLQRGLVAPTPRSRVSFSILGMWAAWDSPVTDRMWQT